MAIKNKIIPLITFLFIGLFLIWFSRISFIKLGMVGAIFVAIIIFMDIKLSLYIFIILSFSLNYILATMGLPGKLSFISDFIVYTMFMYSLINGKKKLYTIDLFLILFLFFIIFSTLMGENSFLVKIKGLIEYIKFPLFALTIMRIKLDKKDFKKMINFIMILAFLQIPTSILQRLAGKVPDESGGFLAMNASTINAILMTIMFVLMLSMIIIYGMKRRYVIASILLTLPFVFSSARGGFIFYAVALALILLFYFAGFRKSDIGTVMYVILGIIIIFVFVYIVLIYIMPIFEPENANTIELITSPDKIQAYLTGTYQTGQLKRLETFLFAYRYLKKDITTILVGLGPGSTIMSQSFGTGKFAEMYGDIFSTSLSLPSFVVNLGLGGVALYIIMYIYILVFAFTKWKYLKDDYFKVIAFALPSIIIIMIIASVYTNVWNQEGIQVVFWFLVASIIVMQDKDFKKVSHSIFLIKNNNKILKEQVRKIAVNIEELSKYGIKDNLVIFNKSIEYPQKVYFVNNLFNGKKIKYILPESSERINFVNLLRDILIEMQDDVVIVFDHNINFSERVLSDLDVSGSYIVCENKKVLILKIYHLHLSMFRNILKQLESDNINDFIKKIKENKIIEKINYKE